MAGRGAGVRDDLLVIERLSELERARCEEDVPDVSGALQCGEVIEQRQTLPTRRGLDLHDGTLPTPHLGGDGVGCRLGRETAPLRVAPAALIRACSNLELGNNFKILGRYE